MSEIHFTQFLMPDGRQKDVIIDRSEETAKRADRLVSSGCRLEIEMLSTGQISMTVERDTEDGEIDLLSQKICKNGPQVPIMVDELLETADQAVCYT